jgi:Zn-dependent oligopeptidase
MFVARFKVDVNNKDAARRFRDQVLGVGGRQPESKTFEDFVGRPPSIEPYLEWLGLA